MSNSTILKELQRRSRMYLCDRSVYCQIIERHSIVQAKYLCEPAQRCSTVARLMRSVVYLSPAREVEDALAGVYPLPLVVPQALIRAVYNRYLDGLEADFVCRFVRLDKVEAIGNDQLRRQHSQFCLELVCRPSAVLVYALFPLLAVLQGAFWVLGYALAFLHVTAPCFAVPQRSLHTLQPVLVLRVALWPDLLTTALRAVFATLLLYLSGVFRSLQPARLLGSFARTLGALAAAQTLCKATSLLLPPASLAAFYKLMDPLGQLNHRFHNIFDEAYRADTAQYARGGYARNSEAPQLSRLLRARGVETRASVLDIICMFVRSLNPFYRIRE